MLTKKTLFLTFCLALIILPTALLAAGTLDEVRAGLNQVAGKVGFKTGNEEASVAVIVGRIIKVALSLVGVVFMVLMVYGGYLWMTAAGNEENVDKAKNLIRAAVIGLIIIASAYSITALVVGKVFEATTS